MLAVASLSTLLHTDTPTSHTDLCDLCTSDQRGADRRQDEACDGSDPWRAWALLSVVVCPTWGTMYSGVELEAGSGTRTKEYERRNAVRDGPVRLRGAKLRL